MAAASTSCFVWRSRSVCFVCFLLSFRFAGPRVAFESGL